jgi:hypothetical protein
MWALSCGSGCARPAGLEPATRCLEGSCSIRLSYGRPAQHCACQRSRAGHSQVGYPSRQQPATSARRDTPARRTGARLARTRPRRYPACPANSSVSRSRTRLKPAESCTAHAGRPVEATIARFGNSFRARRIPHSDVPYPVPHCGNSHMVKMPPRAAEVARVAAVIETVHSYCQRNGKGIATPVGMASYFGR